eukprot:TRINITY_DN2395_c0_g1_i5.p1 TRINITY_DN2395_c0_g1~~TRINITY_DN2395_c0_g1_i5.p1  ORF type:complete len:656 (-),score=88.40 TRINITY_DN2395_c0_g1_i5:312-2279(-)
MLRSAGDARPVARRSLLRMGNVFFPLAIAAPLIRFTIKSVWDLPIGSSLFPRFPSSQEPERRSSSDCTDDRLICSELLDNLTPLQSSILMQHTAVRSIGFSAIESDQKTEATERNRTSGFGRARHLEGSLVGDAASRTQGAAQTAKTKQDKWSLGDDLPMESAAATDVLVADAVKIQKFSANASAGEKSDLIDAAATDLRTVASQGETMAAYKAAKGVAKEGAMVTGEKSTERLEIEKVKQNTKGDVDTDVVAISQIADLPNFEVSSSSIVSLVDTLRGSIRRSFGDSSSIPVIMLVLVIIVVFAVVWLSAHIIIHWGLEPGKDSATRASSHPAGMSAFNRGEQLGRPVVASAYSLPLPEHADRCYSREDRPLSERAEESLHTRHKQPVNRTRAATEATPPSRSSVAQRVVDHPRDATPNSSLGEGGTLPTPQQSFSASAVQFDGPIAMTSSHLEYNLCEDLVIPKNSECVLYIPPLEQQISGSSVSVENIQGGVMFQACLDNSPGVGSNAASGVQATQLLLTDGGRSVTFASCSTLEEMDDVTSLSIRHASGSVAGKLRPTADGPEHFAVLMNAGWGLHIQAKSKTNMRISDLKRQRLLALVELPQGTTPMTGTPRRNARIVTIGPEVDAGLIILAVIGIDWLRSLQESKGQSL